MVQIAGVYIQAHISATDQVHDSNDILAKTTIIPEYFFKRPDMFLVYDLLTKLVKK